MKRSGTFGQIVKVDEKTCYKQTVLWSLEDALMGENWREMVVYQLPPSPHLMKPMEFKLDYNDAKKELYLKSYLPWYEQNLSKWLDDTDADERIAQSMKLLAQLCKAIAVLHINGVPHGDLKPDNIMVDENLVLVLTDFGACRFPPLDQVHFAHCTWTYRAPELFSKKPQVGLFNDIWSLGLIMLELLSGENRVFAVNNSDEAKAFVCRDKPFPVQKILSANDVTVDQATMNLLCRCLTKDYEKRPSIFEFYYLLKQCQVDKWRLEENDIKVEPVLWEPNLRKWSQPYVRKYDADSAPMVSNPWRQKCLQSNMKVNSSTLALAISICDRVTEGGSETLYHHYFETCLALADVLLLEKRYDRLDPGWIAHIVQRLDFDVYRPVTKVDQKELEYIDVEKLYQKSQVIDEKPTTSVSNEIEYVDADDLYHMSESFRYFMRWLHRSQQRLGYEEWLVRQGSTVAGVRQRLELLDDISGLENRAEHVLNMYRFLKDGDKLQYMTWKFALTWHDNMMGQYANPIFRRFESLYDEMKNIFEQVFGENIDEAVPGQWHICCNEKILSRLGVQ